MIAKAKPIPAYTIPRLNALVFGLNIQKLETTKKKSETPKNTLSGESGCFDSDL